MRALHLVLTSACNLSCTYCYQDRRASAVMAWETARRALERLFRSRDRELHLHLYGGEPLLAYPLLRRVVRHARAATPAGRLLRIDTSTNGLRLDPETVAFLATHEVGTQVSFDGVPRAQDLRRPGSFGLLDRRLRWLKSEWPAFFENRLEVAVTVTAAGLEALSDSVEYFLELGVPTVLLAPRINHDPAWGPGGARELERQVARVCRSSRRHRRRTGRVPIALFRRERAGEADRRLPARMCGVGSQRSLAVDVDGSVYGCVLFAQSYQRLDAAGLRRWIAPLRVGHLDDRALDQELRAFRARIHRSPLFARRDRKRSRYGRCSECPALSLCAVCPVSIAHIPGNENPHRIPDLPCAFTRAVWRHVRHFPFLPTDADRLAGRTEAPELLRELRAFAAVSSPAPRVGRVSGRRRG